MSERDALHQSLSQLVSAFRHWQYRCPGRVLTWPAEVDALWERLTDAVMEADALLNRLEAEKSTLPVCWLCRKPIEGEVCYQAGRKEFPSHREHLVTVGQEKEGK